MIEERAFAQMTPEALEALSHPLRQRLLSALRVDGEATASSLAARLGESSGLTSYHLRKLADVGLVAEVPERGTKRERWWMSVHQGSTWDNLDMLGDPRAQRASREFRRTYYAWHGRLLQHRLIDEENWDDAWVEAASDSDDWLDLTPDQAKAMTSEIWELVQRYRAEGDRNNPESARVVWFHHLVPIFDELPL